VGLLVFALFATGCASWAARRARGRQRLSWLALALGLATWSLGEAVWCYYELWKGLDQTPFPSAADAGFLLFPVGAGVALLLFPADHSGQSRTRLVLDGVLVAGSLFLVSWITALGNVYQAGADTRFALVVSVAYPIADLVIITMTIVVLARSRTTQRLVLGLLAGGVMLMALSDSAFAYLIAAGEYRSGNLTDLGWVAAFGLLGLAALASTHQSSAELAPTQAPTSARLWLPYLPVLLAGAVAVNQAVPSLGSGPIPATAVTLVLTLLVRQFVALADNRRLLLTVARQAFHDPLTGLANRELFSDRLNHAVQRQRRELIPLGVVGLDLDKFKQVNDTFGHPAGDELLIRVAERLTGAVRTTDTVARLGGDEFAVLIEEGAADALLLTQRIVESFTPPFLIDGHRLTIRPSIGLTIATPESRDVTSESLLKQADLAMYAAKHAGGDALHIHTSDLHRTPSSRTADHQQGLIATP
ncbi:MAG: GGDEF domain-containing protein, partial [Marmoricola sp.]